KEWVYQQYDHMVRTNTVVGPGSGAAVIRIKNTNRALAVTVDGNSSYCLLNPYYGGAIAVAEAARNLVSVGAKPIALSDCLNFGNPEHPETMWHFAAVIEGMSDACNQFKIPVVSGNVSFYNEARDLGIYPTPVVGMIGLIEDVRKGLTAGFKSSGEKIVLIGETRDELGGSEYLRTLHSQERGYPPILHFEKEKGVHEVVLAAAGEELLTSAHDCSEGGLAAALAECCLLPSASVGAIITLEQTPIRMDALLFSESQSRVIVTVKEDHLQRLQQLIEERSLPFTVLGVTGGTALEVAVRDRPDRTIYLSLEEMRAVYAKGLKKYFEEA
ncbi:MAG: AIR synthase related protein, partial [Nitrospiria bacterium]